MGATKAADAARKGQDFHTCEDWQRFVNSLDEPAGHDECRDPVQIAKGPPRGKTYDIDTPPRK